MAITFEVSTDLRELEKSIINFSHSYGLETKQVFSDLLRFIVYQFTLPGYPGYSDWKYTKQQNAQFGEMLTLWVEIMKKKTQKEGWYDAFGDIFMSLSSTFDSQNKGQFFTPNSVCELMVTQKYNKFKKDTIPRFELFDDHVCGSGRLLLVMNYYMPGNYIKGQDIDYNCCLMTVCNFLIHGCVGLVICMDSLKQNNFRGAWLVNEFLYRHNRPTVRPLSLNELDHHLNKTIWQAFLMSPEEFEIYDSMMKKWRQLMKIIENPHTSQ